jgi:tetratricopeptide (TPR) repeat protein
MARSFRLFPFVLAAATLLFFDAAAAPVSAQPALSTSSAATPPKYPEVQDAVNLLAQRRGPEAFRKLEEASRKYPELPSAYVLMFNFLVQMKQENAARFQLELAAQKTPSDPDPFVYLGNIALNERRVFEASQDFEKARSLLAAYPNEKRKKELEIKTMSGIAQVAEAREDWKTAEDRLRDILVKSPDDLGARQRLARCLFQQSSAVDATKITEAYNILKEAKKIDRKNAERLGQREQLLPPEAIMAQLYEQIESVGGKQSPNAEIWYKAALRNAPKDLPTRFEVAKWAMGRGSMGLVKEQADAALQIEADDAQLKPEKRMYPGSTLGRMLCGLAAVWAKDWPGAEKYYDSIIHDSPNDATAKNFIALALAESDDPIKKNRALEYAKSNYENNKNNPETIATLLWVCFKLNQFQNAEMLFEQLNKAVGGNYSNPDHITYVAYILHHQGKDWDAKNLLEELLKMDRPYMMKPEAKDLYERVKNTPKPAEAAKTP